MKAVIIVGRSGSFSLGNNETALTSIHRAKHTQWTLELCRNNNLLKRQAVLQACPGDHAKLVGASTRKQKCAVQQCPPPCRDTWAPAAEKLQTPLRLWLRKIPCLFRILRLFSISTQHPSPTESDILWASHPHSLNISVGMGRINRAD